jgi:MFS transporter, AAHS family, 4-hydroxybenzoate transporter
MNEDQHVIDLQDLIDSSRLGALQFLVIALTTGVIFADGFNAQVMAYITPQLAAAWSIPHVMLGPIFSSSLAGVLVGYLFLSPRSEAIGHRQILIISTAVFGSLTLATALASNVDMLIALRFLTGVALGAAMPSAVTMIAEFSPKNCRSTCVVVGNCGVTLGSIFAGFISALLLSRYGWRAVLAVGGALPLLLSFSLWILLPDSLKLLVKRGNQTAALNLARRLAPAVLIPGNVTIRSTANVPATGVAELFRSGRTLGTVAIWLSFACNLLVYYFVQSWLTTIIVQFGHSQEIAVTATSVLVSGGILSIFAFGPLMDKLSPYKVMGCFFVVAGITVALLGSLLSGSVPLIMVSAFCLGFFVLGIQKSMNAVAVYFYPPALCSTGLGWGLGIGRFGAVAGPTIAGLLMEQGWQPATLFYWASLPMLLGAGAMSLLAWRYREGGEALPAQGNSPIELSEARRGGS